MEVRTDRKDESAVGRSFTELDPRVRGDDTVAKAGGDMAGGARKKLEKRLGRSVVSKKNFLPRRQAGLKNSEALPRR